MSWTPLTWAQRIVWTGQAIAPDSPHYNQAYCCDLLGPLDEGAFLSAFEALGQDVDALRLVFDEQDEQPVQAATGAVPELNRVNVSDRGEAQHWMEARALKVFDLRVSASDCALLRIGADHHVVFFCQHHLVSDGLSTGLMLQALAARYNDIAADVPTPSFAEVAVTLAQANPTDAFDAIASVPPMPLYGRDQSIGGTEMVSIPLDLGADRNAALLSLAQNPEFRALTPMMGFQNILATCVAAWLSRVSGQSDIAFAMPQHNRVAPSQRNVIGLFMEMLPLHLTVAPDDSFATLFARVTQATRKMMIAGGPGTTRVDLLRHRNVVLNLFKGDPVRFDGLTARAAMVPVASSDPAHDVNIEFEDLGGSGQFRARMTFDASRFDAAARTRAGDHFLALVDAFLQAPNAQIAKVDLLGNDEMEALKTFNAKSTVTQPDGTVVDAFLANLSDRPALRLSGVSEGMTHHALDRASDQMAHLLAARGAKAGDRIAIHLPRSVETLVAILAVHKIGAGFVPLEASLPAQRRELILQDTNASLVISATLDGAVHPADAADQTHEKFPSMATPDGLAYVIYTSGSTGVPKGVVVRHRELLAYCQTCLAAYPLGSGKSFAFFSAFGFDLTINSLFMPLISGGEIVVYPEPVKGGDLAILDVFAADEVDIVKPTPSHLRIAVLAAKNPVSRITLLPHSGEAFPTELARRAHETLGGHLKMINEYGPTEAVVGAMLHHFANDADQHALVPLGQPAPGMRIYVLNAALAHQPIGVAGEIAIGGRLAQGYLNRPDLTAERFIPDPHSPGDRIYLTGDLGVFAAPGDLRYLGRMDDQVKLNGVRIELGEVEHAIAKVQGVTSVAAAVRQDRAGSPALVAYVQGVHDVAAVTHATQHALPRSVQLAAVVPVAELPVSANGKINRSALPTPQDDEWLFKSGSRSPETEAEKTLAALFAESLGLARVGADDDFYALGGDSLTAVRITHAARAKGIELAAIDIFRLRTVAAIAQDIKFLSAPVPQKRRRFSRLSPEAKAQLGQALGSGT